jgi:hypothetical protein
VKAALALEEGTDMANDDHTRTRDSVWAMIQLVVATALLLSLAWQWLH